MIRLKGIRATGGLYHRLFVLAVVLKGLDGLLELAAGASLLIVGQSGLHEIVAWLTERELSEDPGDLVANLIRTGAAHLTSDAELFAALYLLAHGIIKMLLAIGLLREKAWVFPIAAAFFAIVIGYMGYRLYLAWSWTLLILAALDAATLILLLGEWRRAVRR
jgi:uncharacterized membrane protein